MKTYFLSPEARSDLENIWDYIATDNLEAADRVIGGLFKAFDGLTRMPGKGHARKDLTRKPVLFWTVAPYVIIYRLKNESLEIVAIIHRARDIPDVLNNR